MQPSCFVSSIGTKNSGPVLEHLMNILTIPWINLHNCFLRRRLLRFQPLRTHYWPAMLNSESAPKFRLCNVPPNHQMNLIVNVCSNVPNGFGEEERNVKSLRTTDAKTWQSLTWPFLFIFNASWNIYIFLLFHLSFSHKL